MEKLLIQGTKRTPLIMFDKAKGILDISGNSFPEDPAGFYEPLDKALSEYVISPPPRTIVNMRLGLFNTSTSKWLLYLFMKVKEVLQREERSLEINWYYEADDDDCLEAGTSYKAILKVPFHLIEYKPEEE